MGKWDKYLINAQTQRQAQSQQAQPQGRWGKYLVGQQPQQVRPQQAAPPSYLPGAAATQQRIAQRPSAWERYVDEARIPFDFQRRPITGGLLKAPIQTLKLATAPIQHGLSALANVGMKLQEFPVHPKQTGRQFRGEALTPVERQQLLRERGRFVKELGQEAWAGITGKKPGVLADIPARVGVPRWASEVIGFGAEMGVLNLATKGTLLRSAKKAEAVAKTHTPALMNKDYALNRSKTISSAVDDAYDSISREYNNLYDKFGNRMVNLKVAQDVIEDIPRRVINKISKDNLLVRFRDGTIRPTLSNIKRMKDILRKSVPKSMWKKSHATDSEGHLIKEAYYKLGDVASDAVPALKPINARYRELKDTTEVILDVITDKHGHPIANKLTNLFKGSGERGVQVFFEKFSRMYPQVGQAMKDIDKLNRRSGFYRGVGRGLGVLGRGAVYGGIAYPMVQRLREEFGGGDSGGQQGGGN